MDVGRRGASFRSWPPASTGRSWRRPCCPSSATASTSSGQCWRRALAGAVAARQPGNSGHLSWCPYPAAPAPSVKRGFSPVHLAAGQGVRGSGLPALAVVDVLRKVSGRRRARAAARRPERPRPRWPGQRGCGDPCVVPAAGAQACAGHACASSSTTSSPRVPRSPKQPGHCTSRRRCDAAPWSSPRHARPTLPAPAPHPRQAGGSGQT